MQRAYGLEVPQNLKEACDPRRLALIVYDMQVGIMRQMQGGDAVTANVAKMLQVARDAGIRVFFLRHMSLPKELMGVFQLRRRRSRRRPFSTRSRCRPSRARPWTSPFVTAGSMQGADLGYIPIVVTDACGAGHPEAGARALASLRYMGDALFTDVAEICDVLSTAGGPPHAAPLR